MQLKHLLLVTSLVLTAACSSKGPEVPENMPEGELYSQAQRDIARSSYTDAISKLKALESRYPFGRYAEQAQLELIYANYKNGEPEAARTEADRFIRLHPQHPDVDYAYYMKGVSSFDQDRGLLARFLPLDMTKRDPGASRDSFNDFAQFTSRFPNSRYAPDAKARMIYLRNLLAAYDIHVGHYYLTRKAYVAAANRGRYVVENFQDTPSVGDGLALMVEAYQHMGLNELAASSLETLKLNYPNNVSLKNGEFQLREPDDKSEQRSWLTRATLGLIDRPSDPLPPGETRASQDIQRKYQEERDNLAPELRIVDPAEAEKAGGATPAPVKRSWFSRLTFGLFD